MIFLYEIAMMSELQEETIQHSVLKIGANLWPEGFFLAMSINKIHLKNICKVYHTGSCLIMVVCELLAGQFIKN